jgi:hypothetical protein
MAGSSVGHSSTKPINMESSTSVKAFDLSQPGFSPPECPAWLREELPAWVEPFRGINGMPENWKATYSGPNGGGVAGVDRFQANQFIVHRPETAAYLAKQYTPLQVGYRKGTFPELEKIVERLFTESEAVEEKVSKLLSYVVRNVWHPFTPPSCGPLPPDRNLDEEALIRSGKAWCNEQARIFVRLCQVAQIPARLIHLFYKKPQDGHTIAEFHNGTKWCLVDATYCILFKDNAGQPLSGEECHDRGAGQRRVGELYHARIIALDAEHGAGVASSPFQSPRRWWEQRRQRSAEVWANELDWFGVINYPLPPALQP